jgi:predicted enzyme related to lactoylglutathione lyase
MEVIEFSLNLTSEHPERLIGFYRDVVQLPPSELGDWAFKAGGALLIIDRHDATQGPAREPHRYLINLGVRDIRTEEARLRSAGATFVRAAEREPWGALIATFLDPDGNYIQLIEFSGGAE